MTYYRQKFIDFKDNSRLLWRTINEVLGKSNDKNSSIDMLNNIELHNPLDIANQFSKYFTTVGANLAKSIPMDGLQKFPRERDSIFLYSTNEDKMSNIINSLPNKSSSGADEISNKILKHLKNELVTPLTIVFNKSVEEGVFPTRLKLAEIILLYKGKECFLLNNYRLISLLLTLSKCLEKAMHYRISQFIEFHNIFYDHQNQIYDI